MKKIILIFICFCSWNSLTAAELKIQEFRALPSDYTAQSPAIFDMDNNFCAALRVEISNPVPLTFGEKIYNTRQTENAEYYYFSAREKRLTITSPGFKDLVITAPAGGFKGANVYFLRLEVLGAASFDVTINVVPRDAQILVNGNRWSNPTQKLAPGDYRVEISKTDYEPLHTIITVPQQPVSYNFNLSQTIVVEKSVTPPEEKAKAEQTGLPAFEAYDIAFKILACKATPDNNLLITIQMTNLAARDRDFNFDGNTRIFDQRGNEFRNDRREIGQKIVYSYSILHHRLITGVPTEIALIFNNIPATVETITLLEFAIGDWKLPFRNFPVTR